jgi:hypothetical protein
VNFPEDSDALAAGLHQSDGDVRIVEETAGFQGQRGGLARVHRRQAGNRHGTREGNADLAVVAHVNRAGHVRMAIDLDSNGVSRAQLNEPARIRLLRGQGHGGER